MAITFADRVKETSTSTGTGDFILGGAASGFQTFNAAVGVGPEFSYCIELGGDWEVGVGELTASTTLQRNTVTASSNSGDPVDFPAGTKTVFLTASADWFNAGGGGVTTVADAAARFALTGLGRLATVYQEDNGFYYTVIDPTQLDDPAGWQALPNTYEANFYISGTDVVVVNSTNTTGVGITLSYNDTGVFDIIADAVLFDQYTKAAVNLVSNSTSPVTATVRPIDPTLFRVYGYFWDGSIFVASNEVFGNGSLSAASLRIEVYPQPE